LEQAEYLTKVRPKKGKLTFRESLGADLAAERLEVGVILLAGNYGSYVQGWNHSHLIWALDALTIAPRRSSPGIEDATIFANVVVLYIEMQQSDMRADRRCAMLRYTCFV
jgi:hypothetical protein